MISSYFKYLKDNPQGYWFKAKWYGWGWVPVTWKGWVVILIHLGIVIIPGILVGENIQTAEQFLTLFFPLITISSAVLFWICYKKGEPPRWNWGNPNKSKKK